MDLTVAMKAFVRVVETGSFSAVAKEFETQQPAISKQVAWLEAHLGNRLIERSTRRLVFTDEALQYYHRCKAILESIAEAEQFVRQGKAQVNGELRIAASVGFGSYLLAPLMGGFLKKFPDVSVDLRLSDSFVDVVAEGIDVSFRIGPIVDPNLISKRVGFVRPVIVASTNYLADHGRPRRIEDLSKHKCILISGRREALQWRFEGQDGPLFADVTGRVRTDSGIGARSLVLNGLGIGFLPEWLFKTELQEGKVKRLLTNYKASGPALNAITPVSRRYSAKVPAFLDYLGDYLAKEGSVSQTKI